jgi:hypothetical protein
MALRSSRWVGSNSLHAMRASHLTPPQLDFDARKATPAALTVAAHPFGGRGNRGHAINHRGLHP